MAYRDVSSDGSVSDTDSEDDTYASWKRKRSNKMDQAIMDNDFHNPLLEQKKPDGSVPSYMRFKKNNIWGSVLQEQSLTNVISKVDVENPDAEKIERDVESYSYQKDLIQYSSNVNEERDEMHSEGEDDYFKLTVKDRLGKRSNMEDEKSSIKDRLGQIRYSRGEGSVEADDISDRPCIRERLGAANKDSGDEDIADVKPRDNEMEHDDLRNKVRQNSRKRNLRDRFGPHGYKQDPLSQEFEPPKMYTEKPRIDITADDSIEKIVNGLVENLQEPKVDLLRNVVELLGKQKTLELFLKTEETEKNGGMLINNNTRRRTPGGVFFTLIKSDPEIDKQVKKNLFQQDKSSYERNKKERNARRREIEKMLPQYSWNRQKKAPPGRSKSLDCGSDSRERHKTGSHSASSSPTTRTHDNSPEHPGSMETLAEDVDAKDEVMTMDTVAENVADTGMNDAELEDGELEEGELIDD